MNVDWDESLRRDAEALEEAVKREERRRRIFKSMEVSEVQQVLEIYATKFSRVIQSRKRLLALLDSGRAEKSAGGGNYVVKHRQEGHVDERLVTAYEALWIKTYGSGAGYIGDPNALTPVGAGGNQMKMADSGERVYRGVAKGGAAAGRSRRSIIKDEHAFNFKRKIDKRMRRLATEIDEYMRTVRIPGGSGSGPGGGGGEGSEGEESSVARCMGCQCFMEDSWRFCARCGNRRGVKPAMGAERIPKEFAERMERARAMRRDETA